MHVNDIVNKIIKLAMSPMSHWVTQVKVSTLVTTIGGMPQVIVTVIRGVLRVSIIDKDLIHLLCQVST